MAAAQSALQDILPEAICHALARFAYARGLDQQALEELERQVHDWIIEPAGRKAMKKPKSPRAELIPTNYRAKPWKAAACPGLFFIGEVVDVTGHLGGFNFQWAWASGQPRPGVVARGLLGEQCGYFLISCPRSKVPAPDITVW